MNPSRKKILYTAALAAGGILLSIGLFVAKPAPQPTETVAPSPPLVDVVTVEPASRKLSVRAYGTVQPKLEIDLVAEVSGKVVQVNAQFATGGFFDREVELIRIDDTDYRFALSRAEAQMASAAQTLATEKGFARQAKREWRDLGDKDANDLFLRVPQLATAEAMLTAARDERDKARLDVQRTVISAPFNGRIRETYVNHGQYVSAGTKIARFHSTDAVEVRLPLSDRQIAALDLPLDHHRGDAPVDSAANVLLTGTFGSKSWQWPGRITRTEASIDVESRVIYAIAEIARPFEREDDKGKPPLTIGQFVEAEIQGRVIENSLLLPREALRAEDIVWVLDAQDRLQFVPVTVLHSDGREVVVQGVFESPARVVTSSLNVAVAGMALSPRGTVRIANTGKPQ